MDQPRMSVAQQIAQAARDFEQQCTGHEPKSVTVMLSEDVLVIALHGALSRAEQELAKDPDRAAQLQEYHRRLFATAAGSLQKEIERITGAAVREAAAEFEPQTGAVVRVFPSGTVVQVFLLADRVKTDVWSNHESVKGPEER